MAKTDEQQQRAEGVARQLNDEAPPKDKGQNNPDSPTAAAGSAAVGDSTTRRGEDIKAADGKEPGRADTGTKGASERPTGTSDGRDSTGVDPQDSTSGGPTLPSS